MRGVGTEGEHVVEQAGGRQRFAGCHLERADRDPRPKHLGILKLRGIHRFGHSPGRIGRGVGLAGDVAFDLRETVAIEVERHPVQMADGGIRVLVESPDQLLRFLRSDLAERVAEDAGMEQSDRGPSAVCGVRARPCVTDGDQSCRYRFVVDDNKGVATAMVVIHISGPYTYKRVK